MPDYGASGEGLGGYWGKIRSDLGRKQPKTCVWVLAVSEKVKRGILQRSLAAVFNHRFVTYADYSEIAISMTCST